MAEVPRATVVVSVLGIGLNVLADYALMFGHFGFPRLGLIGAGNIGEEKRLEYTVIGGPVNEAARLTELAKGEGGVLASDAAVERASGEADRWELGDEVELRGRAEPTRLAKPRS